MVSPVQTVFWGHEEKISQHVISITVAKALCASCLHHSLTSIVIHMSSCILPPYRRDSPSFEPTQTQDSLCVERRRWCTCQCLHAYYARMLACMHPCTYMPLVCTCIYARICSCTALKKTHHTNTDLHNYTHVRTPKTQITHVKILLGPHFPKP